MFLPCCQGLSHPQRVPAAPHRVADILRLDLSYTSCSFKLLLFLCDPVCLELQQAGGLGLAEAGGCCGPRTLPSLLSRWREPKPWSPQPPDTERAPAGAPWWAGVQAWFLSIPADLSNYSAFSAPQGRGICSWPLSTVPPHCASLCYLVLHPVLPRVWLPCPVRPQLRRGSCSPESFCAVSLADTRSASLSITITDAAQEGRLTTISLL